MRDNQVLTKLCNTLKRTCENKTRKTFSWPYFFYLLNGALPFYFSNEIRFLILENTVKENGMLCPRRETGNLEKLYDSSNFFRLRTLRKRNPLRIFYTHFRWENGLILHSTRYYLARKDTEGPCKKCTIATARARGNKRGINGACGNKGFKGIASRRKSSYVVADCRIRIWMYAFTFFMIRRTKISLRRRWIGHGLKNVGNYAQGI